MLYLDVIDLKKSIMPELKSIKRFLWCLWRVHDKDWWRGRVKASSMISYVVSLTGRWGAARTIPKLLLISFHTSIVHVFFHFSCQTWWKFSNWYWPVVVTKKSRIGKSYIPDKAVKIFLLMKSSKLFFRSKKCIFGFKWCDRSPKTWMSTRWCWLTWI